MKSKDTLNDFKNQLARQQMEAEVAMGVRRLSYEDFKRKARAYQIEFTATARSSATRNSAKRSWRS